MVESKSDKLSKQYKDKANKEYNKPNLKSALILYNKAICYAVSKECLALGYANRAAVFLELKKYDECLLNIQWARDNGYPADKIQKLNEREEKAKRLKATQVKDPVDDPWNFLKLSHPPNPKIPFIVDCLEMRKTKKFGRGIYATRDISTGDIISIEDSVLHFLFQAPNAETTHCANCFKTNMLNLIPCLKTASFMFCSEDCREKVYKKMTNLDHLIQERMQMNHEKIYADMEEKFGCRKKLTEFFESVPDIKKMNYSVFDFDWSNPNDPQYGINQIKCALSFAGAYDINPRLASVGYKEPTMGLTQFSKLIEKLMKRITGIFALYGRGDQFGNFGITFANLINHSCIPNVSFIRVDTKIIVVAIRPIKSGDQIFTRYNINNQCIEYHATPTHIRRNLTKLYGFDCDCYACLKDLHPGKVKLENGPMVEGFYLKTIEACDAITKSGSLKQAIEQWKLMNEFITKHHENLLLEDVPLIIEISGRIIEKIALAAAYPCDI